MNSSDKYAIIALRISSALAFSSIFNGAFYELSTGSGSSTDGGQVRAICERNCGPAAGWNLQLSMRTSER